MLPAVLTEFKHDINQYLANTPGEHPGDLTGLIEYNRQNAQEELTGFGQELFEMADQTDGNLSDPTYRAHREAATGRAQTAIDDALVDNNLDAIVTPTELRPQVSTTEEGVKAHNLPVQPALQRSPATRW